MEKNNRVTWVQLIFIIGIAGSLLGFLWQAIRDNNNKLDLVKDDVSDIREDVGWIRGKIEGAGGVSRSGNLLDRMHE